MANLSFRKAILSAVKKAARSAKGLRRNPSPTSKIKISVKVHTAETQ